MSAAAPPGTMRVLLAWPDADAGALRRGLKTLAPAVDITLAPADNVLGSVGQRHYYHVLYLTPEAWAGLKPEQRRSLGQTVCLVALGPQSAGAVDSAGASILVFEAPSLDEAVSAAVAMHRGMAQGRSLEDCLARAGGRLRLVGEPPRWPDPRPTPARSERQASAPDASPPTAPRSASRSSSAAVYIANVEGDVVYGDSHVYQSTESQTFRGTVNAAKVVQKAGGDQININRMQGTPDELVQQADGDQVNINRMQGTPDELVQQAGGDQVNQNRMASSRPAICPRCARPLGPEDRFCTECGYPR